MTITFTSDGSVTYPDVAAEISCARYVVYGCTDINALNFNPEATDDDGSCNQLSGFYPPSGSICLNSSNDTIDCDVQTILELQSITQIVGPYAYVNSPYSDTILFYADDDFTVN